MRRILTSLPYEQRIGLPSAANGLSLTDSVRRTLLTPVADTQLDADAESASGRLVKCDEAGSLLADRRSHGYGEVYGTLFTLWVDIGVTEYVMHSGYRHLEFDRRVKAFISNVYICDTAGNYLQEIMVDKMVIAVGVRWKCHLIAIGLSGSFIDVIGYHFR